MRSGENSLERSKKFNVMVLGTQKKFNLPDGREVIVETGKLAKQADGSAVIKCGDTVILATV